jgi:trimeric autotransporter adhesin
MRRLGTALLAVMFVSVGVHSFAQTFTGGLRGAVRDSGGVIPGAEVLLLNEATKITRTVTTNEAGEYVFAAVQPGTYTLRATLQGYKTYEQPGIRISTQQFITLDVMLELGQLQETVTVTGQAPLIETSNASGGGVIDSQQLETLPSAGRAAFLIGVTVPTVVATGDPQFNRQQDQTNASLLSLGGGGRRANNYLVDGVQITDLRNRASANPTIEALEEVKVQVHTFDAEMGRTGGGVFNTATKSGTNEFHGAGFFQTRPEWGTSNNYFNEKAGVPKPSGLYYNLGGGGIGGPIVKNRTFFWAASEGYGSNTTRNGALIFPTEREKRGDFSQSFNSAGQLIVIYDPLTGNPDGTGRQPFPGNVIPANRINPVAARMASYFPTPDTDTSVRGQTNFRRTAEINDRALMYTGKVDHKFSDKVSLSGFYLYNKTDEPCANYWEPGLTGEKHFADPNDYILERRVSVLAINNTYIPSDSSVATFRVGWTRFIDDDTLSQEFDPASLGFSQNFLSNITVPKFPGATIEDYGEGGTGRTIGAIAPSDRNWWSWSLNGTYSRFFGGHTIKLGADYRTAGLDFQAYDQSAGNFIFDKFYTSANPLSNGTATSGNAFASFLLGYPTGEPGNLSTFPVTSPLQVFERYWAGYIQDDWRASSKLTLNFGVRLEGETGLMEKEDRFTVAFDREAVSPVNVTIPADAVAGTPARQARGGLIYAGVDGAPRHQGDPPAVKAAPRVGAVYAMNPETVIRAGYGMFFAPWNYQSPSTTNYGQFGYNTQTFIQQGQFVPSITLDNPFPQGLATAAGNSGGLLSGVGSEIRFIDQEKGAPRIQQYLFDLQRELPGNMAVSLGYMGARGDDLNLGAESEGPLNINELDPALLRLGPALLEQVPNPFFGTPHARGQIATPTVQRRQLLRPYPQFHNVFMLQSTQGKSRYHAVLLKLNKRVSNGWGGQFHYTWSRLDDNQFGQANQYSRVPGSPQSSYDLDAEYSRSIVDVPHRIILAPIVELPWGQGRKYLNNSGIADVILGGWTLSAIVDINSGFPVTTQQNTVNHQSYAAIQRPNLVEGADANTEGNREDRFANYLNPSAFTQTPAFTLGNAPRTLADVRTPHRNNIDASFAKNFRLGGTRRAQVRFEVLNLTNTVKVNAVEQRVGRGTFGQITSQAGFMRITQVSFRYSF